MAEILSVIWGDSELSLRRTPSEGVWREDRAPFKRASLPRPTRLGRLDHPESGGQLGAALLELIQDVDVNIPCWLLLPAGWALRFSAELPDLKEQNLILGQLRWEILQRLTHDASEYRFVAALMPGGVRWSITVVREELVARCLGAAKAAEIELAGIAIEPGPGEQYSFEHPLDLRDSLPVEPPEGAKPLASKKVSPIIPAVIGVAVIVVAAWLFSSSTSTSPKPEAAKPKPQPVQQAAAPPVEPPPEVAPQPVSEAAPAEAPPTTTPPQAMEPQPVAEKPAANVPQAPVSIPAGGSPLRAILKSLPAGAKLQLLALSSSDLKIEVSGLPSPDSWLEGLKKSPALAGLKLIGKYDLSAGKSVAARLAPSGWKAAEGPKDGWKAVATSAGMNVKGKIAAGNLEALLTLLDKLWNNPSGASKLSIAPKGSDWIVAVQ